MLNKLSPKELAEKTYEDIQIKRNRREEGIKQAGALRAKTRYRLKAARLRESKGYI